MIVNGQGEEKLRGVNYGGFNRWTRARKREEKREKKENKLDINWEREKGFARDMWEREREREFLAMSRLLEYGWFHLVVGVLNGFSNVRLINTSKIYIKNISSQHCVGHEDKSLQDWTGRQKLECIQKFRN